YEANFDASKLSSGIYFYTLSAKNFTSTKKMILLK
ncbi:MAG: T9SS type A sorting domain-containing protein, partial [Ignavibacteriota bacterium]